MRNQRTENRRTGAFQRRSRSGTNKEALIFDHLKSDHRQIEDLCERITEKIGESASEGAKKNEESTDFSQLKRDFSLLKETVNSHSRAEEEVFYNTLKERSVDKVEPKVVKRVEEAFQEHHVVDLLLEEMHSLDPADERWGAKMTVVQEALSHHIDEEEGKLFKSAEKEFDREELISLGAKFQERKEELLNTQDMKH